MPDEATSPRAGGPAGQDPYEVLGVDRRADEAEMARAFRRALRRTHPDMGGSAEEFAAVQAAWQILGDPDRRAWSDAPSDEWAFDDWGVDLDYTAAGPEASPRPGPHPTEAPDGFSVAADLTNPFAAGAVPLPDPTLPVPRVARARGLGWMDRLLGSLAIGAGAAVVITMAVGNTRIDGPGYGVVVFLVLTALAGWGVLKSTGGRGVYLWALVTTALALAIASGTFGVLTTASSVLVIEAAVAAVAVHALLSLRAW